MSSGYPLRSIRGARRCGVRRLSVVTAVILGGASLAGGRGTILGTVLGVLILGTLNNGLTLMNVNSFWQDVAREVLLLVAVGFNQLRLRLVADR